MYTPKTEKPKVKVSAALGSTHSKESTFQFKDKRSEADVQRKLQSISNNSSQVKQLMVIQKMANENSTSKQPIQFENKNRKKNQAKKAAASELAIGRAGGAARAQNFAQNWQKLDWRNHIKTLSPPRTVLPKQPVRAANGKTIFNLTKGEQIIIDQAGGYWRHYDGSANYYTAAGAPVANTIANHPITHFLI